MQYANFVYALRNLHNRKEVSFRSFPGKRQTKRIYIMINETDKIEAYQFENRLHELPNKPERIREHAGVKASNNDWNQIISRKDEREMESR